MSEKTLTAGLDVNETEFVARIRQAIPIARQFLIENGVGDPHGHLSEQLRAKEPDGLSEDQMADVVDWMAATYAFGIAVGLMLDPAMFQVGKARL